MKASSRTLTFIVAATLLAAFAFSPWMDRLSDRSFAWHMLQHLLLLYPIPLALLAARPFDVFAAVAPKAWVATTVRATRPFEIFATAPIALAFFVGVLWVTHFSSLYELALDNVWLHLIEHALYLACGIAFWLPVVAPPPLRPLSHPARILYLAVALPQGALLGMALFAPQAPLYPHYARTAASSAQALADQHAAAAVMWIAGGAVILAAMLVTLGAWAQREAHGQT